MLEGSLRKLTTLVEDGVFTEEDAAETRVALRDTLSLARILAKTQVAPPQPEDTIKIQGNVQSLAEAMEAANTAPIYPQYPPAFISMFGVPQDLGDTE